jgi:hypothetical protein
MGNREPGRFVEQAGPSHALVENGQPLVSRRVTERSWQTLTWSTSPSPASFGAWHLLVSLGHLGSLPLVPVSFSLLFVSDK